MLQRFAVIKQKVAVQKEVEVLDKRPTMEQVVPPSKSIVHKMGVRVAQTRLVDTRLCADLYTKEIKVVVEYIVPPVCTEFPKEPNKSQKFLNFCWWIQFNLRKHPTIKFLWAKNTRPLQFCFVLADGKKVVLAPGQIGQIPQLRGMQY